MRVYEEMLKNSEVKINALKMQAEKDILIAEDKINAVKMDAKKDIHSDC